MKTLANPAIQNCLHLPQQSKKATVRSLFFCFVTDDSINATSAAIFS